MQLFRKLARYVAGSMQGLCITGSPIQAVIAYSGRPDFFALIIFGTCMNFYDLIWTARERRNCVE